MSFVARAGHALAKSRPRVRAFASMAAVAPESPAAAGDIFSPTPEYQALREMVRSFAEAEVGPQALAHNRAERFNRALFGQLGELGLLMWLRRADERAARRIASSYARLT